MTMMMFADDAVRTAADVGDNKPDQCRQCFDDEDHDDDDIPVIELGQSLIAK